MRDSKVRLAPRSPWQAIDLGCRLYRHWAVPITQLWLLVTALPFALTLILCVSSNSGWPLLLFWWLKPLWERPLLAYYSAALFNDEPSPLAIIRQWRRYALSGLLAQLSWRRLSPWRSFNAGIWQLEGGDRHSQRQRLRALHHGPSSRAGMLTLLLVHIEQGLVLAMLALLYMLVPWQFNLELSDWFIQQGNLQTVLTGLCWYLAMTLSQPLYVACGFALYLNKRTWLEGWDLQLSFSRIGQRRRHTTALLLLIVALPLFSQPQSAQADAGADSAKQEAIVLLADDSYMPISIESSRQWRFTDDSGDDHWQQMWRWLAELFDSQPERSKRSSWQGPPDLLVWSLVWALFLLLSLWLLRQIRRQRRTRLASSRHGPPPSHVAGLDIRQQHLPSDLAAAVQQALTSGQVRDALALLMRASLARLLLAYPCSLPPGCTEQHCLQQLQQAYGKPPALQFLARLTTAWVNTAWAHRPISVAQASQLLADWQTLDTALQQQQRGVYGER